MGPDTLKFPLTPGTAQKGCAFLSVGLTTKVTFEQSVLKQTRCRVMALDPRKGAGEELANNPRFQHMPLAVGAKDGSMELSSKQSTPPYAPTLVNVTTFDTAIEELHAASSQGLSVRDIVFVKIDAPGAECDILEGVVKLGVPMVRVDFYISDTRKLTSAIANAADHGC